MDEFGEELQFQEERWEGGATHPASAGLLCSVAAAENS